MFTIGELAKRASVSADSIRFYERQRLIFSTKRTDAGYHLYGEDALRRISFIKHAQRCRFTLAEIRELLGVHDGSGSFSELAYHIAVEKKGELESTIDLLRAMADALSAVMLARSSPRQSAQPYAGQHPLLAAFEAGLARHMRAGNANDQ